MENSTEQDTAPTETASLHTLKGRPRCVLFEGEPRTIRLVLEAGDSVPPHRHPDRQIVLLLMEGELSITIGREEYTVEAGDVIRFDGRRSVSPKALTDSRALLVMANSDSYLR